MPHPYAMVPDEVRGGYNPTHYKKKMDWVEKAPIEELYPELQQPAPASRPAPSAAPQDPEQGKYTGVMDFLKGSASDLLSSHPSRKGLSQTLADPTRRALLAFAAGMMDTSAPKWQQLDFGTQMSRALNAGLDEYAKASKSTFKAPKIFEKKFEQNGKRMGQQGYMDWRENNFQAIGSPYPLDKPGTDKGPKRTAPNLDNYTAETVKKYLDPKDPDYNNFSILKEKPYDPARAKAEAKAKKEGGFEAYDEHFATKLSQEKMMERMENKERKKMLKYNSELSFRAFQRENEYKVRRGLAKDTYDEWHRKAQAQSDLIEGRQKRQAGRDKPAKYSMPDGTQLSLPQIISLYKVQNPKEAGGLAGFAMAMQSPENAEAWLTSQSGAGSFGKWLDKIGFTGGLNYLQGRVPRGQTVNEYPQPGQNPEHDKVYKTPQGLMKYNGNDDTYYPKKYWGDEKLWSIR